MLIAIIISSVVLFIIIFSWIALYLFYRFVYYSPRKNQINDFGLLDSKNYAGYKDQVKQLIVKLMDRPYEDLYTQSFDGLKLHARLFENKASKKVAILCHGYRGTAYRDFCGGGNEIIEMGYNTIIIDQRAHGSSEGHSITFGIRETKDLLKWIDYAKERFGNDIELLLVGVSMGGHVVLSAADKVDPQVKIIADCPFSSPKAIIVSAIKSVKLPVWLFYPILNLAAKIFCHENMNKTSAFESIKNSQNKILIIHGDKDSVVPFTDSVSLYDAYPDKIQYELFPDADHGMSYVCDTERYKKIINDFLVLL